MVRAGASRLEPEPCSRSRGRGRAEADRAGAAHHRAPAATDPARSSRISSLSLRRTSPWSHRSLCSLRSRRGGAGARSRRTRGRTGCCVLGPQERSGVELPVEPRSHRRLRSSRPRGSRCRLRTPEPRGRDEARSRFTSGRAVLRALSGEAIRRGPVRRRAGAGRDAASSPRRVLHARPRRSGRWSGSRSKRSATTTARMRRSNRRSTRPRSPSGRRIAGIWPRSRSRPPRRGSREPGATTRAIRIALTRAAIAWTERGLAVVPADTALTDARAASHEALWQAYEQAGDVPAAAAGVLGRTTDPPRGAGRSHAAGGARRRVSRPDLRHVRRRDRSADGAGDPRHAGGP